MSVFQHLGMRATADLEVIKADGTGECRAELASIISNNGHPTCALPAGHKDAWHIALPGMGIKHPLTWLNKDGATVCRPYNGPWPVTETGE